ncbi:optomotor-blind protein [Uranotaenia lowii]|uniref:optomotor-blind protein n=1 Tax=Uranotaenia lowii TaxID=190385 RepID=UPI002479222E|nr:optomotor-blind protein [Uranotaenia lowii]
MYAHSLEVKHNPWLMFIQSSGSVFLEGGVGALAQHLETASSLKLEEYFGYNVVSNSSTIIDGSSSISSISSTTTFKPRTVLLAAKSAGGEGSDVDANNIQDLLNDTDSELSSLSHVDAPNDVLYMVCGVVIAMLLVGLIIVLVAVTISKLRKREESSVSPVSTNVEAQHNSSSNHHNSHQQHYHHTSSNNNHSSNNNSSGQQHHHQNQQQYLAENGYSIPPPVAFRQSPSSVWVFPPLPPQPNLYHINANSQDALVHNEKTGLKGLKRQLSGRFKKLVSRKSQEPVAPTIPPELKPQLKTIYVY